MTNINPNPRFVGLFIPSEILDLNLTSTECMLLAWIDALYCKNHGGCYASNEYFCQKLHLKDNTVKILISKLVEMGLVERVSFDGRQRVIRACKEKWFSKNTQSTPDVDYNQPQTLNKINPCGGIESTPHNIYIEKLREKKYTQEKPKEKPKKNVCVFFSFGEHVKLTKESYDLLCKEYGTFTVDNIIVEMNDYISSKGKPPYKDYAATIRTWIRKNQKKEPVKNTIVSLEENKKYANNVKKQYKSEFYKIEITYKGIEFIPKGSQGQFCFIEYSSNGFKDQVDNQLRKMKFNKEKVL